MNAFEALGLNEQLVQSITDLGFETPTSIQEKAIPVLLSGTTDFIGLAQTGTGKTAAFGFPLLQLIDPTARHAQALIVCPTRELCLQITNDIETYKKHSRGIFTEAVSAFATAIVVSAAAGRAVTSASLIYAVSASASWRSPEKFRV